MSLLAAAGLWGPPGLLLTFALHPALCLRPAPTSGPPHRDYCVLGAGPAGLQMAYFLQRAGRDYAVFERAPRPGSFFTRYPRHRKLISINKRHTGKANAEFNLRHDWNSLLSHDPRLLFRHYSSAYFPDAGDMVRYLDDFADRLGLHVLYNTTIAHVTLNKDRQAWNGHYFILTDQMGHAHRCSVLLVATGLSVPNQVDFPGSEYTEGYESVSVDPKDFEGQNVLILGRGNSAFETAENILGVTNFIHMLSRSRVRLSWATHYVGDLRAINNGLLDTYQLKSLDGLLESDLTDLAIVKDREGKFRVTLKFFLEEGNQSADAITLPQDDNDNFAMRVAYDRVIRCLGWNFDFSIFDKSLRLSSGGEFSKKYPLVKASYESKGSRGLFVLGTASHSVDYRKSAGGFIHGFRYTEQEVRFRPADWALPRPTAIHHIVEDFLTDWTAPVGHILPLRRFLENCLDTDLRSFYAESCFLFALTHQKLPPFCQQGYLRTQGLVGTESLRRHGAERRFPQDYATVGRRREDGAQGPEGGPLAPGPPLLQPHDSNKEEL
ncbi:FAD-dependent oxidoreductase domain-containing protein 2 isoform X3 [Panthera tigris]|uniref:FAD-dependent oxidoreductase domain-containing protein 2 isoform X3 n=1 Tax=Panthera tigris TaxID=9694 RepID=UPI001C6F7123|nr:FAD-dependent oxidoreductase domain-containing protein 2 isoform X3 [Panthera tigris]